MTAENRILQGIPASPGIVVGRAQVLTEAAQISTRLLYTAKDVADEQEWFQGGGGADRSGADPAQGRNHR